MSLWNIVTTKNSIPFLTTTLILAICSALSYFKLQEIFWVAELSPYVFVGMTGLFGLITIVRLKEEINITWLDLLVISFLFYSIVSSHYIAYPATPTDRIYENYGSLIFYCWIRMARLNSKYTVNHLYGLLAVAFFQACWGILQKTKILPVQNLLTGVQGGFINPGIYGCFMSLGLIIGVYLILIRPRKKLKLAFLCFISLAILTALIESASRTAMITALIGISLMVCFLYRESMPSFRSRILILSVISLVIAFITFLLWQQNTISVAGRILIWKVSLNMWGDNPIMGLGYGNFFSQYANYQSDYFLSGSGSPMEIETAGTNYYPFNELLKIGIENGLLGLSLFVSILAYAINSGWLLLKLNNLKIIPYLLIIISVIIFGIFSYPFQSPAISCLYYCSLAMIARSAKLAWSIKVKPLVRLLLLSPYAILIFLCTEKIIALYFWNDAKQNITFAEGDAIRKYRSIYPILSANGAFLYNYGAELAELGLYKESLPVFIQAAQYGNSIAHQKHLADLYQALRNDKIAEKYYLRAAYMEPKLFLPFYNLLIFYSHNKQIDKAIEIAHKILNKPVKIPSRKVSEIKEAAALFLKDHSVLH